MSRGNQKKTRYSSRNRRRARVRARVSGTATCPRINVFRSLRGMNIQLIDDVAGKTIVSVDSKKDIDTKIDAGERTGKVKDAYILGNVLATKAKEHKISQAVFDRAGYTYQGRVQAAAEGARAGGLKF